MKLLSRREVSELSYLSKQHYPIWGGHLYRDEPLNDQLMARWLELGLIRQVNKDGYVITDLGRAALEQESTNER